MSALDQLVGATRELQRQLDVELDLLADTTSWLDYRLYLFRMYGFHVPVERAFAALDLDDAIEDACLRNNKVPLLAHDLVALGVDRRDFAQLPRMPIPSLEIEEALGWMYVVESATLSNRQLREHLGKVLPLEIDTASAFLRCYGREVEARWQAFCADLARFAEETGTIDVITAGAVDCLVRLERWLRPAAVRPVDARLTA